MKHFFGDAISIYERSSRDEYGRENWGSGNAVSGRFILKESRMYNAKGDTIMADALVHLPAGTSVQVGSRMSVDSSDYKVIKMKKPKDGQNVRFIKCYLQRLNA